MRQLRCEQCRRQLAWRRGLPCREQRNQAARALDELQIGNQIAHLFEIVARQQRLAFDHDQHVEFRRREALGFRFILPVFLGIGPEQLTEGIVDLDALDTEDRTDNQRNENDAGQDRRLNGDQPQSLQTEGDAGRRPPLDLLDMDLTVAVLFEHALSSSHVGFDLYI